MILGVCRGVDDDGGKPRASGDDPTDLGGGTEETV